MKICIFFFFFWVQILVLKHLLNLKLTSISMKRDKISPTHRFLVQSLELHGFAIDFKKFVEYKTNDGTSHFLCFHWLLKASLKMYFNWQCYWNQFTTKTLVSIDKNIFLNTTDWLKIYKIFHKALFSVITKDCFQNKFKFITEDQFTEHMNITTW